MCGLAEGVFNQQNAEGHTDRHRISDWTEMADGVPRRMLSGPENFLNMINDPHTDVDDVK